MVEMRKMSDRLRLENMRQLPDLVKQLPRVMQEIGEVFDTLEVTRKKEE
jgi:hypothetical protein